MLFDFVEESYRAVATKTLVKRLDAQLADREHIRLTPGNPGASASDGVTIRRIVDLELPPPYVCRPVSPAPTDHQALARHPQRLQRARRESRVPTSPSSTSPTPTSSTATPLGTSRSIEDADGDVAGYVRTRWEDREDGTRDYIILRADPRPAHLSSEPLYRAVLAGQEAHMRPWAEGHTARFVTFATHPGPDLRAIGRGGVARVGRLHADPLRCLPRAPHLDDIPERTLPEGVEVRPVTEDQLRTIFDANWEDFRGSFDFREATEQDFNQFRDNPVA